MKHLLSAVFLFGAASLCLAQEGPIVLILQRVAVKDGKPVPSDLQFALVDQLRQNFLVKPVLWGLGDETFRNFAYDGLVPSDRPEPTDAEVRTAAKAIKAEFTIILDTSASSDLKGSKIRVFRGGSGKSVWERTLKTGIGQETSGVRPNLDTTVARTWSLELIAGPFKPYRRTAEVQTPTDPVRGPEITPDPPLNPKTPLENLRKNLDDLIANNQSAQATELLYAEIDLQPMEPVLRQWLIALLLERGKNEMAAQEARRSLILFPGDGGLRILRMRCLMQIGQYQEASSELNEALARDPENPEFLEMSGHIQLARGNYSLARTGYLKSLSKGPRITAQAGLAIVVAVEGDTAEIKNLLTTLAKPSAAELREMYQRMVVLTGITVDRIAQQYRDIMRQARMRPDVSLTEQAQKLNKTCEGLAVLVEFSPFPQNHQRSHSRRIVAYKLLSQAAAEVLQFMRTGEPDAGEEATVSLSEALNRCQEAKSLFETE